MTKVTQWHGCYDGNLKDLIIPEAFKHPAKMSRKLCERIFDYGREQGYWQPGDTIIDPFGGIGTTGIIGAYRGYHVICVELEEKFVKLAWQNFELNWRNILALRNMPPFIVQGDSRKLLALLGQANGCVTSPPFLQSIGGGGGILEKYGDGSDKVGERTYQGKLGDRSSCNIEILPEGDHNQVVGAISSPPWEDSLSNEIDQNTRKELAEAAGISNSADQPPIPTRGAITSPPYEKSNINPGNVGRSIENRWGEGKSLSAGHEDGYSRDKNNLGNQSGDTYWSAVALIYQ